jgi:Ni,Fe-hydrogenase I small subunit
MKPNLKIVPVNEENLCKGCFYFDIGCRMPTTDNELIDNHCLNNIIYIETPRHAVTVPDSE